jgi:hypothetical protein
MLYREIIAVCSQIHTKHTNTLCGRNVEFLYTAQCDAVNLTCQRSDVTTFRWNVTPFGLLEDYSSFEATHFPYLQNKTDRSALQTNVTGT